MTTLLAVTYTFFALLLSVYTGSQLILLLLYLRHRNHTVPLPTVTELPPVLVQLPIYNEKYVVQQLLNGIAQLDYPKELLTVQVLDDSTDDTVELVAELVTQLREQQGLDIHHIRRPTREDYKAGALAYGLSLTDTELIAVFDADFIPPKDFLRRTVPYFSVNPQLGIVQTRWGHLNAQANLLTRAQSLAIDAHFIIEQTARNYSGLLLTFNGTGGIWRRQCIEEAGGWSADTLTEDLDLSYRAQMAGWEYLYLPHIVVPGEIPPVMTAYKRQQARWAQGTNQCLAKLFVPMWRSHRLSLGQKLMGTQHLVQYLPHTFMMILLLLTPLMIVTDSIDDVPLAALGMLGFVPPLLHFITQATLHKHWVSHVMYLPVLMVIGTGIMLNNVRAAFNAFVSVLTRRKSEFMRTPKFGKGHKIKYALKNDHLTFWEVGLAVYALFGLWLAITQEPGVAPYMALYVISFVVIVLWNYYDRWQLSQRERANNDHEANLEDDTAIYI